MRMRDDIVSTAYETIGGVDCESRQILNTTHEIATMSHCISELSSILRNLVDKPECAPLLLGEIATEESSCL